MPGWRNWQTRYIQGVVPARACRFESCAGHTEGKGRYRTEGVERALD